ncbi:uncharacterized protein BYT42DRAFT_589477 [Radiomyces spectabilis]|uniref:uncharacterized protein n=1 Tax=Radiomyces spectabilis TaxID=64574 RepID=UPI00221FF3B8|nr:uncharacterized protein BYT42DRAFT_589477 [Radiomyces spectabilis]KAI8365291.1 hypothetical protein BYT42DRAFT_589477 [Radiomyces spectabilis]
MASFIEIQLPRLAGSYTGHASSLPSHYEQPLSSLLAVFNSCKRSIQDGFRLENLSWRLWYRQFILRTSTSSSAKLPHQIQLTSAPKSPRLSRTRSLPSFKPSWSSPVAPSSSTVVPCAASTVSTVSIAFSPISAQPLHSSPAHYHEVASPSTKRSKKFFIDDDDNEEQEPILSVKLQRRCSDDRRRPVSLLSTMLKQYNSTTTTTTTTTSSYASNHGSANSLRRCQTRYHCLDQLVALNA